MRADEDVVVLGEDVGAIGGIFGCTQGLHAEFGPQRCIETPICEASMAGGALGAALAGLKPVLEIQIFDHITVCMDQVVNQAAKLRFMLGGGDVKVPLVIRGPQGGGIRLAAQHSQSLEAWFAHVPGLVVVAPSSAYDTKGLLLAAMRDPNPVIFLEHKNLYQLPPTPVPEERYEIALGKAAVRRAGSDLTVIAWQSMVHEAMRAAKKAKRELGIEVEVIDLRTLAPLDTETILASVRKTNRVVVAHEACLRGGLGGEIAALVAEHAFDYLDAPPVRVGALGTPMPYNDKLERAVIPGAAQILAAIKTLF